MTKTIFMKVRVDYDDDGRYGSYEADSMVADMVVERAQAHNHTVENGIRIEKITNHGIDSY
jgi:hypothetical protein